MPKRQQELDVDQYDIPREELLTPVQREVVEFDEFNLNEEFTSFAGRHADWTALYARAYKKAKAAKHNEEIAYAKAFIRIQEEETERQGKKPTEATIKAMVILDAGRIKAHKKAIIADAEREKIKTFLSSIESKREMMRSLGAKFRAEMSGDLAMKDYIKDEENRRKKKKEKEEEEDE